MSHKDTSLAIKLYNDPLMIGDDPTSFSKQGLSLDIDKPDIDPKLMGMIHLNTSFRVSGLLSHSKQYRVTL